MCTTSLSSAQTEFIQLGQQEPRVHAALKFESAQATHRVGVAILLGGFETGKAAISLVDQPHGLALASLDYPFALEGKWNASTILSRGLELRRALRAVDAVLCDFIDRLRQDPRIDPEKIIIVGASFGVPYALGAASGCGRTRALILLHGFGDPVGTLAARIRPKIARATGEWLARPVAFGLAGMGWLSLGLQTPEAQAKNLPAQIPVLWIEASEDDLIPESSRRSLREVLEARTNLEKQEMPGGHLRPGNTQQVSDLLRRSVAWLRQVGVIE